MDLALLAFDGFTDIDLFLPWDLLHRPREESWRVRILGTAPEHVSATGFPVRTHGTIDEVADAGVVVVGSGLGIRPLIADPDYLARLGGALAPERQLIGSMCAGSLLLAALGLLEGRTATTYPTSVDELAAYGVDVVEEPFVRHGGLATAAGCLAAQDLIGWIIGELLGEEVAARSLAAIQPVGSGLGFDAYTAAGLR